MAQPSIQNSNAFRFLVAKSSDPPYSLYWTEFLTGGLPLPNDMVTPDTVKVYHSPDDINFTLRSSNTGGNFVWQIWNWNWAFTVNPNNNNHLVFGSRQVFQSFDGGNSFATMGWVGNHDDQHDFEWRSGSLFVANDGGVSYNNLFGVHTWETDYNIGLRSVFITNIDAHNNKLIGGFWHAGSKIWDVGDNTALQVGGGDGFKCFYDNAVDSSFYFTSQDSGFINQDLDRFIPNNSAYWGQPFFQDPQFPDYLWFAQNRVYFWHKNSNTFTDVNVIPDTTRVHRLAVCTSNSNRGYAAFHQVEKFIDFTYAGAKIDRASSLPIDMDDIEDISHIEVDQLDPDKLWITLKRYNQSTVFYSDDRGVSWEDISLNLPQVPIYKMARVQSNNQMYLATEYGIYYKNDSMSEWIRFSNGLGYQRVVDIVVDNGYVYASLFGPGVFRSPLRLNCPAIQNVTASNYANPLDPGHLQLEAFDRVTSDIHLRANLGTNVKLAGGNYVELSEGFLATSIADTTQIEGITQSE
ncbi:MAG: hypothetical protein AAGK97_02030, partial [Bacteroidota bacterium]